MSAVPPPPAKPRGMSERRYRELHDSIPCTVTAPSGTQYHCCGAVSAHVIARKIPGATVTSNEE